MVRRNCNIERKRDKTFLRIADVGSDGQPCCCLSRFKILKAKSFACVEAKMIIYLPAIKLIVDDVAHGAR